MAGLGYKDFTAGAVLTAAQVDGYLMEQAVMNFAGTAARGSALSSVQSAGMMAHVGGGTVTVYDGSAWKQVYPASAGLTFVAGTAFSAVSSVSVNNCFTSEYDNYRLVCTGVSSASGPNIAMRLRANGSDNSSSTYGYQTCLFNGTVTEPSRTTLATSWQAAIFDDDDDANAFVLDLFRPNIATRTSFLTLSIFASAGSYTGFFGGYFDNSTVFDGFSFIPSAGTITGTVRVYGYRNS